MTFIGISQIFYRMREYCVLEIWKFEWTLLCKFGTKFPEFGSWTSPNLKCEPRIGRCANRDRAKWCSSSRGRSSGSATRPRISSISSLSCWSLRSASFYDAWVTSEIDPVLQTSEIQQDLGHFAPPATPYLLQIFRNPLKNVDSCSNFSNFHWNHCWTCDGNCTTLRYSNFRFWQIITFSTTQFWTFDFGGEMQTNGNLIDLVKRLNMSIILQTSASIPPTSSLRRFLEKKLAPNSCGPGHLFSWQREDCCSFASFGNGKKFSVHSTTFCIKSILKMRCPMAKLYFCKWTSWEKRDLLIFGSRVLVYE